MAYVDDFEQARADMAACRFVCLRGDFGW